MGKEWVLVGAVLGETLVRGGYGGGERGGFLPAQE